MIEISAITKRYGTRIAVDDATFGVATGRVTGFVGPNGAGKSTTMRMMVGLSRPDTGEVRYAGTRYTDLTDPARVVGAVLDARAMHPGRTARNHLRAAAALSNIASTRVDEVLDAVGLTSVAVLLLDEPSNGLDPDGIRWLRTYLRDFADQGGTVFVSSHLIAELAMFADDLVVIGGGRILAADTVDAITAGTDVTVVTETPHTADLIGLLATHGISADVDGHRLRIHGTTRHDIARLAFDHRIRLDELTETTSSLEDILLDLTNTTAEFASA